MAPELLDQLLTQPTWPRPAIWVPNGPWCTFPYRRFASVAHHRPARACRYPPADSAAPARRWWDWRCCPRSPGSAGANRLRSCNRPP